MNPRFEIYQTKHEQGYYFPCTHRLATIDFLQYSIHTALQDEGVVEQKSFRFHSRIPDSLALIWMKVASQQLRCHPIEVPTIKDKGGFFF